MEVDTTNEIRKRAGGADVGSTYEAGDWKG